MARNCKPKVAEKLFRESSKLSRTKVRQIKPKQQAKDRISLQQHIILCYKIWETWLRNTCLSFILIVILIYFCKICTAICTVFTRNRNLKEILSSSMYTKNKKEKKSHVIKNCGKCDICKNYLISDNTFTWSYQQEILYQ